MFQNLHQDYLVSGLVGCGIDPSPWILLLTLPILHVVAEDIHDLFCRFLDHPYINPIFQFSLSFKFDIIQGGSLSLKITTLFGMKFEKNIIKVLLGILTCS